MDRRRLSDVRAGTERQIRASGSGYLIGQRLVLTVRHVAMDDAGEAWPLIEVRVGHPADGPPHRCFASVQWHDVEHDLTLLRLHSEPTIHCPPVRWGVFIGSEPVPYEGLCFPRFADYSSGRGVEQLGGRLPPLAVGESRGYVLDQSAAPSLSSDSARPWGGASGTAVFCKDLLVGVVSKDDRDFTNRRLHAVRIDGVLANPEFARLVAEDTGALPAAEAVELNEFLQPSVGYVQARTPGSLLAADVEAVDFTGREYVLDQLAEWRNSAAPIATVLIVGEGGQGKTRLAREFAARTSGMGWVAGFANLTTARSEQRHPETAAELGRLLRTSMRPILIIADYAETHPDDTADIIDELLTHSPRSPVRLLLLSRAVGAWWDTLAEALPPESSQIIGLSPLTDSLPERRKAYAAAVIGLARHIRRLTVDPASNVNPKEWSFLAGQLADDPPDLSHERLGNALTLHMTALTDLLVLASGETPRRLGKSEERQLVRHERDYLRRAAARRGLYAQGMSAKTDLYDRARDSWFALERALAGLILLGPCDADRAKSISDLACPERANDVLTWLAAVYPPSADWLRIGSVQPDRLAELLLGDILTRHTGLLNNIGALADDLDDAIAMLLTLLRTASHPQFGTIGEQARNLVVSSTIPFAGAALVLAVTLARAASIQGVEHAVTALEALSRRAEVVLGTNHSQALVTAANMAWAKLALLRDVGSPRRPTRLGGAASEEEAANGFSSAKQAGQLHRDLAETSPDFVRDLLEALLNILDIRESETTDHRRDIADQLITTSTRAPAATDDQAEQAIIAALYSSHYQSLVHLAALLVRDMTIAEEVVQDAFVAMHGGWRRLRDSDKALSYLRQSVVNRSRSVLRHRAVIDKYREKPMPTAPSSEEAAIAQLERSAVVAALRTLPSRQREVLVLRYYGDFSMSEIANWLDISEGAVRGYLSRGLTALRRRLNGHI